MHRLPHRAARAALAVAATSGAALTTAPATAQTTISYSGGVYSQFFDTLPGSGTIPLTGAGPFDLSADPINAAGMSGWSIGRFGGTGANLSLIASPGSSLTGAAYSFGSAGDGDRALGSLASGTVVPAFGAVFVNTSSTILNSFTLDFVAEQWRNSGAVIPNTLAFSYAVGGADIFTGDFNPVTALDATTLITGAPAGSLNGNLPANRANRSATVGGFSWMPGESLVIRWVDTDDPGSDHGIGIDELTFTAIGGAKNLVWNPAGAGGTTWTTNPASTNWLDGPDASPFANGDVANFTNSGVGAVVVDAGGVAPGATTVSNSTGTYTISGGPLGGGVLTKTNDGTLVLIGAHTYTGGTVVNGGVLAISSDDSLGNPTGGITLGGGRLRTNATITLARSIALTGPMLSAIDTAGNDATFGAISGGGSLVKQGAGRLTFTGAYNITGTTTVTAGALVLAQSGGLVTLNLGDGGGFIGDLEIANPVRVNFNGGTLSGGGTIRVNASGTVLANSGDGQPATIGNPIVLNNANLPQPFITYINAIFLNPLTITAPISGNSDVSFAVGPTGVGAGVLTLAANNTWTGNTVVNNSTAGVVRLGVDNALPPATALTFGSGSLNVGALDLAGFDQSIASLASDTTGTINGIVNSAATMSTLSITGSAATTYAGTIGIPADQTSVPTANTNIALVLDASHSGALTLASANTYSGGTAVRGGTLVAGHYQSLGTGPVEIANATLRLAPGLGIAVVIPPPSFSGSAKLDMSNNAVVFDHDGAPIDQSTRALIASGYAGGAWTGDGITSDAADASQFGVGYAESSALPAVPPLFGDVDSTALLLRLTRYGDANLDGTVNLADFNRLAGNFGSNNAVWSMGDFNYDGIVNLADFNRLAGNFGLTAGPDGPTPADWAALAAIVPEPGCATWIGLAGAVMLRRRRRE